MTNLEAYNGNGEAFESRKSLGAMIKTNKILSVLSEDPILAKGQLETKASDILIKICKTRHLGALNKIIEVYGSNAKPSLKFDNLLTIANENEDLKMFKILLAWDPGFLDIWIQPKNRILEQVVDYSKENGLDLSHIAQYLPSSVISREALVNIDLSHNNFSKLTATWVQRLTAASDLESLDLSHNNLSLLPYEIGLLTSLKSLNLSNNKIEYLPSSVTNLTNLKELKLKGNKLSDSIPSAILKKDPTRLIEYLKECVNPIKTWNKLKVLVVGKENVGKTHLIKTLKNSDYPENLSTDGISVEKISLPTNKLLKKIEISIFDFGGQEIFYPTHTFYITDRSVYLVVFSLVDEKSHIRIEYWLRLIKSTSLIPCSVILVGTHKDMCVQKNLKNILTGLEKVYRQIYPMVKDVIAVSCKSLEGIKELKHLITEVAQNEKIIKTLIPGAYITMDSIISKQKGNGINYLTWKAFKELAKRANMHSEKICIECAEFLHSAGRIIWFNQHKIRGIVILNPQWLSDVMSSVISFKTNWKNGIIHHSFLSIAWKQFPSSIHQELVNILRRFEVMFPIRGNDMASIVPSMLPENPEGNILRLLQKYDVINSYDSVEILDRTFNFDFMPLGFFGNLIVKLYHCQSIFCFSMYRSGVVVTSSDICDTLESTRKLSEEDLVKHCLREGQELAFLQYFGQAESASVLNILIFRNTNRRNENLSLITVIVDIIETLLSTSYSKYEENVSRWAGYNSQYASVESIIDAILENNNTIKLGNDDVLISLFAPDLYCSKIPRFSDVEIFKKIGEGSMGVVYLGKSGDKELAIKQIKLGSDNERYLKFREFQNEAKIMYEMDHPCLVNILGVNLSPLQILMEYVPGNNLMQYLHSKDFDDDQLPLKLRVKFALDIALGIQHLQERIPPIVHRDLRSPNIFVCSTDPNTSVHLKIADFGIAAKTYSYLTEVLMTWQWLPPEAICLNEKVYYNESVDIYSFGIVFYEILTRQIPFSEYTDLITTTKKQLSCEQVNDSKLIEAIVENGWIIEGSNAYLQTFQTSTFIEKITNENLRPTIPSDIPNSIKDLIQRCWRHEPDQRPSIGQIVEVLTEMYENDSYDCIYITSDISISDVASEEFSYNTSNPSTAPSSSSLFDIETDTDQEYGSFYESLAPSPTVNSYLTSLPIEDEICPSIDDRRAVGLFPINNYLLDGYPVLTRKLEPNLKSSCRVMRCISNNKVCVGTNEGKIHIFSTTSYSNYSGSVPSKHNDAILSMEIVGSELWCGSADKTVTIWDIKKEKLKKVLKLGNPVQSLQFIPSKSVKNSLTVLSGDENGEFTVWSNATPMQKVVVHKDMPIGSMSYVESTQHLWIGSFGTIYIYSIHSWDKIYEMLLDGGVMKLCVYDNFMYIFCNDRALILVVDTTTFDILETIILKQRISSLQITKTRDGQGLYLWCGHLEGNITVLDSRTNNVVFNFKDGDDMIYSLIKIDENTLWSGSREGWISTLNF